MNRSVIAVASVASILGLSAAFAFGSHNVATAAAPVAAQPVAAQSAELTVPTVSSVPAASVTATTAAPKVATAAPAKSAKPVSAETMTGLINDAILQEFNPEGTKGKVTFASISTPEMQARAKTFVDGSAFTCSSNAPADWKGDVSVTGSTLTFTLAQRYQDQPYWQQNTITADLNRGLIVSTNCPTTALPRVISTDAMVAQIKDLVTLDNSTDEADRARYQREFDRLAGASFQAQRASNPDIDIVLNAQNVGFNITWGTISETADNHVIVYFSGSYPNPESGSISNAIEADLGTGKIVHASLPQ